MRVYRVRRQIAPHVWIPIRDFEGFDAKTLAKKHVKHLTNIFPTITFKAYKIRGK